MELWKSFCMALDNHKVVVIWQCIMIVVPRGSKLKATYLSIRHFRFSLFGLQFKVGLSACIEEAQIPQHYSNIQ